MAKVRYYKYKNDAIDIRKKIPPEVPGIGREKIDNFALLSLRKKNLFYSRKHKYLEALIIEFNKKMRVKSPRHIAEILKMWLSPINNPGTEPEYRYFVERS